MAIAWNRVLFYSSAAATAAFVWLWLSLPPYPDADHAIPSAPLPTQRELERLTHVEGSENGGIRGATAVPPETDVDAAIHRLGAAQSKRARQSAEQHLREMVRQLIAAERNNAGHRLIEASTKKDQAEYREQQALVAADVARQRQRAAENRLGAFRRSMEFWKTIATIAIGALSAFGILLSSYFNMKNYMLAAKRDGRTFSQSATAQPKRQRSGSGNIAGGARSSAALAQEDTSRPLSRK